MSTDISVSVIENTALASCVSRLCSEKSAKRPVSTYRFQFNAGFRFEDARQLLPYLHAMGVSHCYASPILRARAGSQHGYDITNHNEINPEIGTPEEFAAFVHDLKALRMGLILDIVPNHMGVGHGTNPWWQDVLENGQASEHADFFDIDWSPLKAELRGKVLLPVLGDAYGDELEQGHLKVLFENGAFYVSYHDKRFPLDPATYPLIFEQVPNLREFRSDSWTEVEFPQLQAVVRGFGDLAPHGGESGPRIIHRQKEIPPLKQQLARLYDRSGNVRDAIDEALHRINGQPGSPASFDALHRLLESQAYRLAHWRVSAEEINYRRFFDINDLVGLRMENPAVFAETHKLIRKLLADGSVDGLRLDHPDGLFNPVQYFTRIQMLYSAAHCCGPEPTLPTATNGLEQDIVSIFSTGPEYSQQVPMYVLVEKILEHGEDLPKHWPVDGTVGYEFGNALNHVFINSRAKRYLTNFYHRFIGGSLDINKLVYESKMLIMRSSLSSEVTVLTHMLEQLSSTDRRARDITRTLLKDAIRETVANFPVYRTYIDARGTVSEQDRAYIGEAIARAKRRNPMESPAPYDFLKSVLLLESPNGSDDTDQYRNRLRFTLKFQQLTGPVMAKGLEDTACYVFNRFISANEVGGSPAQFGIGLQEFHDANLQRARDWPNSMLGTSTHDSKRSEDVRARLNVLSEMPKEWSAQVIRWRRANRSRKRTLSDGRVVPDANEEYFFYQTLVGTWPEPLDNSSREGYIKRIQQYMTKAIHEAKVNLSWINQNQEYVDTLMQFTARVLTPETNKRHNLFVQQMAAFIEPVRFFGAINSLAQVLLKITSPGVPDIYRGTEFFDFSLVDPDNRRPVDYDARQRTLAELLQREHAGEASTLCEELSQSPTSDKTKMWTTIRSLRFRRDNADVFRSGDYIPLFASEAYREHVIAFARRTPAQTIIVAAPRFPYTLMNGERRPPIGEEVWKDARIELPIDITGSYRHVFTDKEIKARDGQLLCREVFARFPVALLSSL